MRRGTRQPIDRDLEQAYRGDSRDHNSNPGIRKWAKRILLKRLRQAAKTEIRESRGIPQGEHQ